MEKKKSQIIKFDDLILPANYNYKPAENSWKYTCRVCDADVYDGCQDVVLADFFSDFEGA